MVLAGTVRMMPTPTDVNDALVGGRMTFPRETKLVERGLVQLSLWEDGDL